MIRKAYEEYGRLIDTHTAVGCKVAEDMEAAWAEAGKEPRPTVILSTASPFKFAKDVYEAIFGPLEGTASEDEFAYMEALSRRTGAMIPAPLAELKTKPVLHKDVVDADKMAAFVKDGLKVLR
jgi:threonine synthase